jgi:predicted DNA-binding antitoxin AbrB/MazE fold protein
MSQSVRAIYHDGQLRLLDPVDLAEGQEIRLEILPSIDQSKMLTQQLRAAGLLVENWDELDEEIAALEARGVIAATEPIALPVNSRPSEELIDEDRGDY